MHRSDGFGYRNLFLMQPLADPNICPRWPDPLSLIVVGSLPILEQPTLLVVNFSSTLITIAVGSRLYSFLKMLMDVRLTPLAQGGLSLLLAPTASSITTSKLTYATYDKL